MSLASSVFWRSKLLCALVQLSLRRRHACLRGAQGIELVLRLELGHHLSGVDMIADIDRALDHPSGDAKGQTGFVLRLDAAGIGNRFADIALDDGHRPHRTNLRRGGFGLRLAGREQSRRQSGEQEAQARVRIAEQAAHDREGDAPASARGPTIQAWTTHAGKHAPHVALRGHASVVRTEINAESARASSAPPAWELPSPAIVTVTRRRRQQDHRDW
jgi:hypothetical protein